MVLFDTPYSHPYSEKQGLCRSDVAGLRMKWIDGPLHLIAQYHPTWQICVRFLFR